MFENCTENTRFMFIALEYDEELNEVLETAVGKTSPFRVEDAKQILTKWLGKETQLNRVPNTDHPFIVHLVRIEQTYEIFD